MNTDTEKKVENETNHSRTKVLWDTCSECGESTRVAPITLSLILLAFWVASVVVYLFSSIAGIILVSLSVVATILVGVMTILDYYVLKCAKCGHKWLYKEKRK
jgi:RNase P subunit RPR2